MTAINNMPMGFLSMGQDTHKVSLEHVFAANRHKLGQRLVQNDHAAVGSVAVLMGGQAHERYDSDHEPLFRQESYMWWLTGVKEPGCAVAVQLLDHNGSVRTTLFVPQLPPEYATIMGRIKSTDEWKELYQVDDVQYMDDLVTIVETMIQNPSAKPNSKEAEATTNGTSATNGHSNGTHHHNQQPQILLMKGPNSDSGNCYEPPDEFIAHPSANVTTLFPILAECRVVKSNAELDLLRYVTELTSYGHAYVMRNIQPSMMEYQGESLFRHYCYFNYGCRLTGYTSICGCGPNAAILHYGHTGEPNGRQLGNSDMCLFDMGAEYCGYGSDITCSFPASGKFNEQQRGIYNAVLQAQRAVYDMAEPGVSYADCHKAAEAEILKALVKVGAVVLLANTTIADLVEMRLGAVFMPHGLGHLIGIDTHDVGGYLPGHPPRSTLPGLGKLRTARILQPNMTLTVEPGCYFIDHLLDEALEDSSPLKQYLNADLINSRYRGFGGVRLEDVVVITDSGCINYTLCPRTVEEVEHVMAGGKWPPLKDEAPELRRERLTDPNPLPAPSPPSK